MLLLDLPAFGEASFFGEWLALSAPVLGNALAAACERRVTTPQLGTSTTPGWPERRWVWIKHLKLLLCPPNGRLEAA